VPAITGYTLNNNTIRLSQPDLISYDENVDLGHNYNFTQCNA